MISVHEWTNRMSCFGRIALRMLLIISFWIIISRGFYACYPCAEDTLVWFLMNHFGVRWKRPMNQHTRWFTSTIYPVQQLINWERTSRSTLQQSTICAESWVVQSSRLWGVFLPKRIRFCEVLIGTYRKHRCGALLHSGFFIISIIIVIAIKNAPGFCHISDIKSRNLSVNVIKQCAFGQILAEGAGFEPAWGFPLTVFKTAPLWPLR